MKAPAFWARGKGGVASALLSPVGAAYALAGAARRALTPASHVTAPVVCVGNLVAGGAGKTPTVLALADRLAATGLEPHILSRGYGGSKRGPHRVDPAADVAAEVGDEPRQMAQRWPVWVAKNRVAGARKAVAAGADIVILDDGFQNPSLFKDLSLVVVDAQYGHGNGRVIPAGPLREPLQVGLARADAMIVIGERSADGAMPFAPKDLPVLRARIAPGPEAAALKGARVLAFAGIARPEKFFDTLRGVGAEVVEAEGFADHHPFSTAILHRLEARANALGARLVTTEKDAARLPTWFEPRVAVLSIALGFADPSAVDALLRPIVDLAVAVAERRGHTPEPRPGVGR